MHLHQATLKATNTPEKKKKKLKNPNNLTAAQKRHIKADTSGSLANQPWLHQMQGQETGEAFRDCQVSNQPCLCAGERGRPQITSAQLLKTPVTEAEQKTQKDVFVNYLFLHCPFFT